MKVSALALATRQISVMYRAGVPLVSCLEFLTDSPVFAQIRQRVNAGVYLSKAMGEFPGAFPGYYLALVRVGEESGSLETVLHQLAEHLEKSLRLRRQVASALVYPAVLAVVSLGLIGVLTLYILPAMEPLFAQTGRPLPLLTQLVLSAVRLARHPAAPGWLLLAGGLLAILVYQARVQEVDSGLRQGISRALLRLSLVRATTNARLLRMLGLMLTAGMNLRKILECLIEGAEHHELRLALQRSGELLEDGLPLSEALRGTLPRSALIMLASGEEAGRLAAMAQRTADLYEEQVEYATTSLAALLEPLILVATSAFVGLISLATLLPWISLLGELGR